MIKKRCSKCQKLKTLDLFGKCNCTKDGLQYLCKQCRKGYRIANKELLSRQSSSHYYANKESILLQQKNYYEVNKVEIGRKCKKYRELNKKKISDNNKKYNAANREKLSAKDKEYYIKNRQHLLDYQKQYNTSNKGKVTARTIANAKYDLFKDKLTVDEAPRLASDGISLEVKCRYCGKYLIPTVTQIQNRIKSLNSSLDGDRFLYCSDNCKEACPTYGQHKYPKGFKKASSREVNPFVRQLCLKRDNWTCQICGATQEDDQLHCHHLEGVAKNPRLGNDVTNTITLCKTCHKRVHKLPGCNYYELRCNGD